MPQTGPRSPEAKAVVSMNAVRHGLRSTTVVIPGLELQSDWEQFLNDSIASLAPVGAVEYALAERAATLFWRLRRAARAERDAAIVGGKQRVTEDDPEQRIFAAIRAMNYDFPELAAEPPPDLPSPPRAPAVLPPPDVLQTLSRYEFRLSRQLMHTLHEVQALQDRRQGRPAPYARIDIEGLPEAD